VCALARPLWPVQATRPPAPRAWASSRPERSALRLALPASFLPPLIAPHLILAAASTRFATPSLDAGTSWVSRKPPAPRLAGFAIPLQRSEEHTSELQSRVDLVCRL